MLDLDTERTEELVDLVDPGKRRCADCDHDCWDVRDKVACWMGWPNTDRCPWVHGDVPFPPKSP